jgi:hypothetical protein
MLVHYHCLQLPAQILCISQPQNTEISENMHDKKSSPTKDIIFFLSVNKNFIAKEKKTVHRECTNQNNTTQAIQ